MRTMKVIGSVCAGIVLLMVPDDARAQAASPATQRVFVNINFGGQLAPRTVGTSVRKSVYGEEATLTSTQPVSRGALIDLGAGVRVYGDLYVGVSVSQFTDTADATYEASVPDPVVFDLPSRTTGTATGLGRTETAINPHVVFVLPLTDRADLALGIGASIIDLKQRLVSDFSVPLGTKNAVPVIVEETGRANGVYASVDFIFNLATHFGIGGFARFAGGKVDLPSLPEHNVGGMQAGGGLRLRF